MIENIAMKRAHRVERNDWPKNGSSTIVAKILNFKDKQKILETVNKLKGTMNITKEFRKRLKELWKGSEIQCAEILWG